MEGSKGSKNQSQIMPYAQCKTYEQRNECAKYIKSNFLEQFYFFLVKNLLKRRYIQIYIYIQFLEAKGNIPKKKKREPKINIPKSKKHIN